MSEHTWRGDWITKIYGRVQQFGFESVTAFAETMPTATLLELAAELGEDVAAIQLEGILYSEAEKAGTFDWFARGLLVRCIHHWMPAGWGTGDDVEMQRADVFAEWSVVVRRLLGEARSEAIWDAIEGSNIPAGWLPSGPDDPIIEAAFGGVRFDAPVSKD